MFAGIGADGDGRVNDSADVTGFQPPRCLWEAASRSLGAAILGCNNATKGRPGSSVKAANVRFLPTIGSNGFVAVAYVRPYSAMTRHRTLRREAVVRVYGDVRGPRS
jgi:hypothetical protein